MRLPAGPLPHAHDGVGRLGADFAQIYFPAQQISRTAESYREGTSDPWGRPSRYPPLVHRACAGTICQLPYGPASLAHVVLQYLLLLVSLLYVFRRWNLQDSLLPALLLVNVCLFLSPVGLAWFERGQFTLYVALSILWLTFGLIERSTPSIALATLFAYVKWTAFPFVFVIVGLWVAVSKDRAELRSRIPLALLVPAAAAGLFVLDFASGLDFLAGLRHQELNLPSSGLSLTRFLPRAIVKALPFALLAWGATRYRRTDDFTECAQFLALASVLLLLYPTKAFDYSVPCLFGLVPVLVRWHYRAGAPEHRGSLPVPPVLFLLAASYSFAASWLRAWGVSLDRDLLCLAGYLIGILLLVAENAHGRPPPEKGVTAWEDL